MRIRRSEDRGHADHGWLVARHTFSFANYHDPRHMGFGVLRVINQDVIGPGGGFPPHGHADMEIITYVLSGVLVHQDDLGHRSNVVPGDVQVMSAGTGIRHSEVNGSDTDPLELLQIWIETRGAGAPPRYDQRAFDDLDGRLRTVVSADGAGGSLIIGQDASMLAGRLADGQEASHVIEPGRTAWIQVARGKPTVNDTDLEPGDGAALTEPGPVRIVGRGSAEVLLFDLPA